MGFNIQFTKLGSELLTQCWNFIWNIWESLNVKLDGRGNETYITLEKELW